MKAMLDAYNPRGTTTHVSFNTTKSDLWKTAVARCHVNYVVCDSDWEAELARAVENHPRVKAYVKNQGLQFEVPYRDSAIPKKYLGEGVEITPNTLRNIRQSTIAFELAKVPSLSAAPRAERAAADAR